MNGTCFRSAMHAQPLLGFEHDGGGWGWCSQAERAGVPTSQVSKLSTQQHLLAGCLAGAAATAVTYPLETLRTHMAMGSTNYGTVYK